jgi:hypothetical protein
MKTPRTSEAVYMSRLPSRCDPVPGLAKKDAIEEVN